MYQQKRRYCDRCGKPLEVKAENGSLRDYCGPCDKYFYDNPLPVVSVILVKNRKVLLVKRGNDPYQGQWCLPSGFAESGENVVDAALRELEEETGIKGKIIDLQDVDSCSNYYYGDLLFIAFEAEQVDGDLRAGDDAVDVRYFSIDNVPKLAFASNTKALRAYVEQKKDYWAIVDSFSLAAEDAPPLEMRNKLLSNKLVQLIEKHSGLIAHLWLHDVKTNRSTPTFHGFDRDILYKRVILVISHFEQWLSGSYLGQDMISYYLDLGRERKGEGFCLSEVISALSLAKKHIWEFALSRGMWSKTIDIYTILELEKRISLFFDRAIYYVAKGYEE